MSDAATKAGKSQAVPRTRVRDTRLGLLCLLPAALLLAAVFVYPVLSTIIDSFSKLSPFGGREAVGTLTNWRSVFHDSDFLRGALPRTVMWTAGVVAVTVLISIPAALVLNRPFRGRKWARAAVLLPWAVPLPVGAILWKFVLDGQIGTLNGLLAATGITGPVWLAEARTAFPAVILVGVWVSVPFTAVTLLAGLQSIGMDIHEAAEMDGADGWSHFTKITLPLLRPMLNVAVVLNTIYVFNSFPIIWVLTQGGPAGSTDVLITYLYKAAFRLSQPGSAQAMGVISFLVLIGFSALYLRLMEKEERA